MIGKDLKETAALICVVVLVIVIVIAVPIAAIRALVAWLFGG